MNDFIIMRIIEKGRKIHTQELQVQIYIPRPNIDPMGCNFAPLEAARSCTLHLWGASLYPQIGATLGNKRAPVGICTATCKCKLLLLCFYGCKCEYLGCKFAPL